MAPRGNSMVGTFRRTLGNGVTPFYEFTQVMAEKDMVILRQIHVHGNFETDPRRTDLMRLRLAKAEGNTATFTYPEDALYVRTTITSSRKHPNPSFEGQMEQAWIQPVGWKVQRP